MAEHHPSWALGFADEVWWSRLAQPNLHSWACDRHALRLLHKHRPKSDIEPKAVACYGVLLPKTGTQDEQMWLRFASGQPVSALTTQFLDWACEQLARAGKTALLLIWDNASWHTSGAVRRWLRAHNTRVKQTGQGVRIVPCYLPTKSPWLNPIEPKWLHGKRAVLEPERVLSAVELQARVCAYYGCQPQPHLVLPEKVA